MSTKFDVFAKHFGGEIEHFGSFDKLKTLKSTPKQILLAPPGFTLQVDRAFETKKQSEVGSFLISATSGKLPHYQGYEPSQHISLAFDRFHGPGTFAGCERIAAIEEGPIIFETPEAVNWVLQQNKTASFSSLLADINILLLSGDAKGVVKKELIAAVHAKPKQTQGLAEYPKVKELIRNTVNLEIVTRTLGDRNSRLQQNVESVARLKIALESFGVTVSQLIVSPVEVSVTGDFEVEKYHRNGPNDSRFTSAQLAISKSKADFIWFVDDDDVVIETCGDALGSLFSFAEVSGLVFLDSVQAIETNGSKKKRPGMRYSSLEAVKSLWGPNRIPFSSVIFPRHLIAKYASSDFSDITLLEDHFLIQACLLDCEIEPVYITETGSEIRVHSDGQTINNPSREDWPNAWLMNYSKLLEICPPSRTPLIKYAASQIAKNNQTINFRKIAILIFSKRFWRTIVAFNAFNKLIKREISFEYLKSLINRAQF